MLLVLLFLEFFKVFFLSQVTFLLHLPSSFAFLLLFLFFESLRLKIFFLFLLLFHLGVLLLLFFLLLLFLLAFLALLSIPANDRFFVRLLLGVLDAIPAAMQVDDRY